MKKKVDFYSKENPEGVGVPYASCEYELTDEKCNDCKHADTNDTYCVNCTHRFESGTLRFDLAGDYFEQKEEKPTTEYNGCDGCYYEWLGESDAPCCDCKYRFEPGTMARLKAKDCFKSKEEKECMKCIYSNLSEFELPCCECKYNTYATETSCLKTKDCFKSNEEKADDEIDMVNHPQHYQHGIEPIEFIESHNLNFNLGSAVKYIARSPYKGTELLDLKKAKWFIEREIKKHESNY